MFTNPQVSVKFVNLDVFGRGMFIPFSMFLDIEHGQGTAQRTDPWPYTEQETLDCDSQDQLLDGLRHLISTEPADLEAPLSMVFVGRSEDIAAALVRRGYRMAPEAFAGSDQFLGRPPDYVARQTDTDNSPGGWLRLWAVPLSFHSQRVLVGAPAAPLGGRFVQRQGRPGSLDPAVGSMRDILIQEMLYSGGLEELAELRVSGAARRPGSDGRLAVLFVARRPLDLEDVKLERWGAAGSQAGSGAPPGTAASRPR